MSNAYLSASGKNGSKKSLRCKVFIATAASTASLMLTHSSHAASASWVASPTDGNWTTATNWSTSASPGSTSVLTNADIATFNLASSITTINISSGTLNAGGITFDGPASAYTIGSGGINGGSALLLSNSSTGAITLGVGATTFTGTGITERVNAPLVLEPASSTTNGQFTFINNSTTASNVLNIAGNVSGGTTSATSNTDGNADTTFQSAGAIVLQLNGANTGLNTVSGNITDGGANGGVFQGGVGVWKTGAGTWYLTGTNTFSGNLVVNQGILNVASLSNYGVASAIGDRLLSQEASAHGGIGLVINGGTLQYTGSTPQSTNREIRFGTIGGSSNTFDASGSVPSATVAFNSYNGSNINLFQSSTTQNLIFTGSNTGVNQFNDPLSGGAIAITKKGAGTWSFGAVSTTTGAVNVIGGTFIIPTGGSMNALAGSTLGWDGSTAGTYSTKAYISGTIGSASGNDLTIANANAASTVSGTTYLNGGTMNVGRDFYIAINNGGSSANINGTLDVNGGTMTTGRQFFMGGWYSGTSGNTTATLNINAGTVNANASGGNTSTFTTGATSATVNLNGTGVMNTNAWVNWSDGYFYSGSTLLNFNGGTLRASGTSINNGSLTNFLNSSTTGVNLYTVGGTFDTQGNNVTITQPITNPANNALTGINITDTGDTYSAPSAVTFTVTSGTAPTGYTTINSSGGVTGVVITNAGSFTGTVTGVSIAGATGSVSFGSVTTAANSLGGFTKLGSGILTLSNSANSFSGGLTINNGTVLNTGGSTTLGSGNVTFGTSNTPTMDIGGISTKVGLLSGSGTNGVVTSSVSGTPTLTLAGSGTQTFGGSIQNGSATSLGLTVASGTQILTGSSSYTGTTNISSGAALSLTSTGSIPSTATVLNSGAFNINSAISITNLTMSSAATSNLGTGTLTVTGTALLKGSAAITAGTLNASGTLSLQDSAINTVTDTGALSLNNAVLGFDVGNSGSTGKADLLSVGGAVSGSGTETVNINLLPGQSLVNGNYTLLSAASGLSALTFAPGSFPAGFSTFNFNMSTDTKLVLSVVSKPTIVGNAYWTGNASTIGSDGNNNWGFGGSLSPQHSNWSNQSSGSPDALTVPGSASDVIFTASSVTSTSALNTQLDGAYTIQGLSVNTATVTSVGINTNGAQLTIGTDGLNVSTGSAAGLTVNGTGTIVLNGSQTWANNNTQALTVSTPISAYAGATTLTLNGTGSGGIVLGGAISDGGGQLALVLGQTGTGTTTINGSNTFTGGVTLNAGTVVLGNAGAFNSTTPNSLTFGPGSTGDLQLGGNSITVASLNTNAGSPGTTTLENANGTAATFTVNGSGTNTFAGTVQDGSGGGSLSLVKSGAGSLTLSGAISFTGTTTVNSGSTLIESGTDTTTGAVTVNSGGTIVLAGNSTATGNLIIHDGATLQLQANPANTFGTNSSAAGNRTYGQIQLSNGNGVGTSSATIQLRSDNSVTFANTSTGNSTGNTTLTFDVNPVTTGTGQTLTFGSLGSFQTVLNATSANNYTLGLVGIDQNYNSYFNFNASSANITVGYIHGVGALTFLGPKNSTVTGLIDDNNTGLGQYTSLTMAGTGTLTLAGSNTFGGIDDFKSGITNVATLSDYGVAGSLGARTSGQETASGNGIGLLFEGGTLQYTGSTPQETNRQIRLLDVATNTIDASGSNPAATVTFSYSGTNTNLFETAGTRTLNLTGTNTGPNVFAISLIDQAANATSLVKSGVGQWVLTGSSTYSGSTQITGGTLALNSSGSVLHNTSSISIAAGATLDITANPTFALLSTSTLGGSGTIAGNYNHVAGTLSPGGTGTVGTLTVNGNLAFSGGTLRLDLSGSNTSTGGIYNDLLAINGNLSLSGTTVLSVLPSSNPSIGSTYTVITYTGGLTTDGNPHLVPPSRAFSVITSVANAVELQYTGGAAANLTWVGNNGSNWDAVTTLNWNNSSPTVHSDYFYSNDNVSFTDSGLTPNVTLVTTLLPSSVTVNSNSNNYNFSGSGSISGTTGLVKSGISTLTISTANPYSGDTFINNGTVLLNAPSGAGLGTGNLSIGSLATLQVGDGGADGLLANSTITNNGSLVFNSTVATNLGPTITGSGSVTVNSTGALGLPNGSTYSGGTTIGSNGNVTIFGATAFGNGPVTVNPGGNFYDYTGSYTLANTAFNLSGTAIHVGGNKTLTLGGPTYLLADTTINLDGGTSIVFGGDVTSSTNANLFPLYGGRTVVFDGNVSLGTGQINTGDHVVFAPSGATTTISSGITGTADVRLSTTGTTILSGSNTYTGGTTVSAGTLLLASAAAFPSASNVTVNAGATLQMANHSGGTATLLVVGQPTNNGTIDIANNAIDIQTVTPGISDITTINAEAAAAYNGGNWNGPSGITSSWAASNPKHLTAVGVATGFSTFQGGSVSTNDVLVKYTYYGDANLDGTVNSADYALIDAGFLSQGASGALTGWQNGDFNYDGVINGSDYTLIDNAFNTQGAQLLAQIASPTAQVAGTGTSSAVPEPATFGLLAFGATALLGRRRNRHGGSRH